MMAVAGVDNNPMIDPLVRHHPETPLRIGHGFCHDHPTRVNHTNVCARRGSIDGEVDGAVDDAALGIRERS